MLNPQLLNVTIKAKDQPGNNTLSYANQRKLDKEK